MGDFKSGARCDGGSESERDIEIARRKYWPKRSFKNYIGIGLNGSNSPLKNSTLKFPPILDPIGPQEKALSMDHIRESIFSQLDRASLLNSRLVSHRWSYFASTELQKRVTLTFVLEKRRRWKSSSYFLATNHSRTLKGLMVLMKRSESLLLNFLCNSFVFYDADRINPSAQTFFNQVGTHVEKLELVGEGNNLEHGIVRSGCGRSRTMRTSHPHQHQPRSIIFEDLKRLLEIQTPNLKHLIIKGNFSINNNSSLLQFQSDDNHNHTTASFSQKISPIYQNLQSVKFTEKVPQSIIQYFLNCHTNLSQIELQAEDLHYLVKPPNFVHLLKSVDVHIRDCNLNSLEILANNHQGHLFPLKLTLKNAFPYVSENQWCRARDTIGRILAKSSDSCVKLRLERERFVFFSGFAFDVPKMRQVTKLTLVLTLYNSPAPDDVTGGAFFPRGSSLEDIFPKLNTLRLHLNDWRVLNNSNAEELKPVWPHFLLNAEPVRSVKCIIVNRSIPTEVLQELVEAFPNASITVRTK